MAQVVSREIKIAAVGFRLLLLQTWHPNSLSDPMTGNSTLLAALHFIVRGPRRPVPSPEEGGRSLLPLHLCYRHYLPDLGHSLDLRGKMI